MDVLVRVVDVVLASAANGLVGVDGLAHGEVASVVVESEGLVATVAAEAGFDTINELLLGEGEELAGLYEPGTFESASRGETPAGAAVALIFDGGDRTSSDPVDTLVEAGHSVGDLSSGCGLDGLVAEQLFVLGVRVVGEDVVADGEVLLDGVGLLDELVDLGELLKSESVLLLGGVGLAEFGDVVDKLEFHVGHGRGGNEACECSGSEGSHLKVNCRAN